MTYTLKFTQGATTIDLTEFVNYFNTHYVPASPKVLGETIDLVSPVEDTIEVFLVGSGAAGSAKVDSVIEKLNALNRLLLNAEFFQRDRRRGSVTTIAWSPSRASYGGANAPVAEVLGGSVTLEEAGFGGVTLSGMIPRALIHLVRRPTWEGAETSIALTQPTNNGALNYAVVPTTGTLLGDLPARTRIYATLAGGNATNCAYMLLALRADGTPANFIGTYEAESAVTLGAGVVVRADTDLSGGSSIRYTPTLTTEVMIARFRNATNVTDQYGRFLVLARVRDNHTASNFKLRFRAGVEYVTNNISYGPYTTYTGVATTVLSGTTEIGMVNLGEVLIPAVGTEDQAVNALIYELYATANAATASLDVDYIALFPLGEAGSGKGHLAATFPFAITSWRAYADSRLRQPMAYIANSTPTILVPASDLPQGGEILIHPQQAALRLYCLFTRDGVTAGSEYKHDRTVTPTLTMTYVPRYIHMRGST